MLVQVFFFYVELWISIFQQQEVRSLDSHTHNTNMFLWQLTHSHAYISSPNKQMRQSPLRVKPHQNKYLISIRFFYSVFKCMALFLFWLTKMFLTLCFSFYFNYNNLGNHLPICIWTVGQEKGVR